MAGNLLQLYIHYIYIALIKLILVIIHGGMSSVMASNGIILMKQLVTKKAPSFPVTESECTLKICMCIYSSSTTTYTSVYVLYKIAYNYNDAKYYTILAVTGKKIATGHICMSHLFLVNLQS